MVEIAPHLAVPPLVLALDVGTSSVRALLFDRHGDSLHGSEQQIPYELTTTTDGGAFVDAGLLVELVEACIDGALHRAGPVVDQIAAVGISCFWHSLLGLDKAGDPITPVLLWADRRSAREVEMLRATVDRAELRTLTGCVIHSSYWPAKLRWWQRQEPDLHAAVALWCSFSDYLLSHVTGSSFTSISMASGTGLLDIGSGDWSAVAADIAGISISTLPRIAADGSYASGLSEPIASRWPALRDRPWFPALGDGACANAGTGALAAGRIALSLGTSGAMRIAIAHRVGTPLTLPDDLWAYRLDQQRVVLGGAISNGGKVLAYLGELLGVEFGDAEMDEVASLQPDSHGLTILPFLAGERSPIWNDRATAVIAGLTLSTGKPDLLRAGMESVSLRLARVYEGLCEVAAKPHQIVANGAAILKSPAWLQMTADALDHEIVALPADEESSARGAAVMALLHGGSIRDASELHDPAEGARVIRPEPANVPRYRQALERQRDLERLLFPAGSSWDTVRG